MPEGNENDREKLEQLIRGFQISQLIYLAAELDLAGRLPADAIMPIAQLAEG